MTSVHVCVCAKSLRSCLILCDPKDYSLPGSTVHGTLQARVLEWVTIPNSSWVPGIKPVSLMSLALAGGFFTTSATWEARHLCKDPIYKSGRILRC